jgi:uncharacterized protein
MVSDRAEGQRAAGQRVAELLGLRPLPHEGGLFRQTYADGHSAAIYFMLLAPDFSAMHALGSAEVYHWYTGAPLGLLLLGPDGGISEPVLGPGVDRGQHPQLVVPAGTWQGSSSLGAWTLVGTTTAPPFDWSAFRLGDRAELIGRYPAARDRIDELTR